MELMKRVQEEITLRDQGKYGRLENLTNLELIALAYKLGIKPKG